MIKKICFFLLAKSVFCGDLFFLKSAPSLNFFSNGNQNCDLTSYPFDLFEKIVNDDELWIIDIQPKQFNEITYLLFWDIIQAKSSSLIDTPMIRNLSVCLIENFSLDEILRLSERSLILQDELEGIYQEDKYLMLLPIIDALIKKLSKNDKVHDIKILNALDKLSSIGVVNHGSNGAYINKRFADVRKIVENNLGEGEDLEEIFKRKGKSKKKNISKKREKKKLEQKGKKVSKIRNNNSAPIIKKKKKFRLKKRSTSRI